MSRLLFYLAASLLGDAMLVVGAVAHNLLEVVVALVIAAGAWLMLATGWWLSWERTTCPDFYDWED